MLWRGIFLMLLCLSQLPDSRAGETEGEEQRVRRVPKDQSDLENHITSEELNSDLEILRKFLLGHLDVTVPPERPLLPPKTGPQLSFNVTLIAPKKEKDLQEEEEEEAEETEESSKEVVKEKPTQEKETEDEEDLEEETEDDIISNTTATVTEVAATTPAATTVPADDNLSYILSRLSGIESAIHRLHVQFYGLDVKVSQMSQSLSKIRNKLSEAEDSITSMSELHLRNQRQIGQIEGCLKGRRYYRKCYLIFQHFETYATAQENCRTRGGNLAMPIDQQEFAAMAKYVQEAFFPFNWPIWIGINDHRSDGMYLFENGQRVSYFNWYKDHLVTEPNGGVKENCVSISSVDGKWWDNDCSRRMYYVCEY